MLPEGPVFDEVNCGTQRQMNGSGDVWNVLDFEVFVRWQLYQ
jgi:hypothetical protein